MHELIDKLHVLDEVTADPAHNLHDVVLVHGARPARGAASTSRNPERDVLVTGRVLGEGLEARDLAGAELREEPLVARPEEADVGDVEEEHGDAFKAEPEGPADAVGDGRVHEQVLLDHPAA